MRSVETGNRIGLFLSALFLGTLLLAGCGSGSSGNSASNGNGNGAGSDNSSGSEQSYGALITRIVGTAQPPVLSTSTGASITGIAGASVTSLIQNRTITATTLAANTRFAYTNYDNFFHSQIFTMLAGGGVPTEVTTGTLDKYHPSWSPDGTRIAYEGPDSLGTFQLFAVLSGGGTPTQLTTSNTHKYYPVWSPNGTRIAYYSSDKNGTFQLFTMPSGGGAPTQITTDNLDKTYPSWSPDGTRLTYSANDSSGYLQIFTIPAGGGIPTQITVSSIDKYTPTWSPDGTRIAYYAQDSNGFFQIFTMLPGGSTPTQVTTDSQDKFAPTWSPDSSMIVCYESDGGSGLHGVFAVPSAGGTPTPIILGNYSYPYPSWSPFLTSPKSSPLIGSGGMLGSAAAGFLFAQGRDDILSVLAFDTTAATTASRAGTRITALTPVGVSTPDLVFNITATDSLSRIAFVNYDTGSVPGKGTVLTLPAGTTGALVSFNAATGRVTTVLPYAANRSVGNPVQVSQQGTALALKGRFLAVFDGAGKNQAPVGASEVHIDSRTGQLLSFQ